MRDVRSISTFLGQWVTVPEARGPRTARATYNYMIFAEITCMCSVNHTHTYVAVK